MLETRPGFSPWDVEPPSWITRVRENLRQLLTSSGLTPTSANGAPIHLLKLEGSGRAGRSQTASFVTHLCVLAALAIAVVGGPPRVSQQTAKRIPLGLLSYSPRTERMTDVASVGRKGGGGESERLPATHGFFAPHSSIPLAPPRLPDNSKHALEVTSAFLDEQAPVDVARVNALGIPRMPESTNSAGPGTEHGIGSGKKGGIGDGSGDDDGDGEGNDPRARGGTLPSCLICPIPIYTDEARHVKMQGTVTLRVLVGADGKASNVRVVRGIGFGLEDRAIETVRGWKFNAARDAGRHAVAAWITIEVVFRLF